MMTLEARKLELITGIASLDSETSLAHLEIYFKKLTGKEDLLKKLAKPIRKKMDLETIKKEQNHKKFDRKKFDQLVSELNIQEPIEELIAMI